GSGGSGGSGRSGGSNSSSVTGSSRKGRGNIVRGLNAVGSTGGKLTRKAGGALLGAAAGTVALAAQVADGDLFEDPQKALGQVAMGVGAGYIAGNSITGTALSGVKGAKDWIDKKQIGIEEFNNREFDRKFYASEGYKTIKQDEKVNAMCEAAGVPVREAVQNYLNAGVSDPDKIKEALQNGIGGDAYKIYSDAGIDSAKKMGALQDAGVDAQTYKDIYKDKGIDNASKIAKLKKKFPKMNDESLSNWMVLAQNKPSSLDDFKNQWVGKRWNKLKVDDAMAERIYRQLVNFF
ncbi:MAG: hypothetical protein II992_08715, partial [Lachnospiraceae bacterium]|nr:hypothetical protein [Lachnospiraceae bacterium]